MIVSNRCFHEATSRGKSEVLLENSPEGGFLIRSSSASVNYCLSVRTANAVRHFRVDFDGERYSFGQAVFWSPLQIWEHLQQKPVIECDEGSYISCITPCQLSLDMRYVTIHTICDTIYHHDILCYSTPYRHTIHHHGIQYHT